MRKEFISYYNYEKKRSDTLVHTFLSATVTLIYKTKDAYEACWKIKSIPLHYMEFCFFQSHYHRCITQAPNRASICM